MVKIQAMTATEACATNDNVKPRRVLRMWSVSRSHQCSLSGSKIMLASHPLLREMRMGTCWAASMKNRRPSRRVGNVLSLPWFSRLILRSNHVRLSMVIIKENVMSMGLPTAIQKLTTLGVAPPAS